MANTSYVYILKCADDTLVESDADERMRAACGY